MECGFVALCLWAFFITPRLFPAYYCDPAMTTTTGEAPDTIRFAPVKLRLTVLCSAATHKRFSHLSLILRGAPPSRAFISLILLTSGDIETTPGPLRRWKYLCTICSAPVKSNQRGLSYDRCENWTHASSCGIEKEKYLNLVDAVDFNWICPSCLMRELPCADDVSSAIEEPEQTLSDDLEEVTVLSSDSLFYANDGSMVISHLNIRSVVNKVDDLRVLLERRSRALVFGLSETWLDESVTDAELEVPGFNIHRRDQNRQGGGVLVYVSEDFKVLRRQEYESERIEALWIEVKGSREPLLVCNVYRSPDAKTDWMDDF